ncbi:MAG: cation diffusion facilitator family transporter [bacterium]
MAAAIFSVSVALCLIITKLIAWQMSGSAGVLGSLADSALDLLGSMIALVGVKWAGEPADREHRYGHHKAEAMAGLAQLLLIVGSALYVLYESLKRLWQPAALEHSNVAMIVMILSLVLSIALVTVQTIVVRKTGSVAIEGDRAHYMGDLIANAGTILAIFLSARFGLLRADAIAGVAAGVFLLHAAYSIGRNVIPQLMDEEASQEVRARIADIVRSTPHVRGYHALRTRMAGNRLYLQMHLELDPEMKLRQAHEVADDVELRLLEEFPGSDILLHQDPHGEVEPHDHFGQRILSEEEAL